MSGAEVLLVLPIVIALISAFNDGSELGIKARDWWKKRWGKDRYALKATADPALDQSLSISPVRIQQAYSSNAQRYGMRFATGDDIARMDLMWCLVDMHRDMLGVCRRMLDSKMEYDPSKLLQTSDQIRDRSLSSFQSLAQRLEIQAPIQRTLEGWNRDHASFMTHEQINPRLSRVQTLETMSDVQNNTQMDQEKERLNMLAEKYVETLSDKSRPRSPAVSQPELSPEFNAFCQGPVEECFYSGSLSLWQCRNCGSSISFDYNKVDRSQAFANLIFSCHLPARSETVLYKCIICRARGDRPNTLAVFSDKMDLIVHLGEHTPGEFTQAGFEASILHGSCYV